MEIFKLFGSIFIKSEDAEKSISKINDDASKLPGILGKGIKTAVSWGAAIVTATGGAVTAMVDFTMSAASAADEIDKMSQKIGLSIEGYQEWSYVMGQNGMDIDKLQTGMKTLVQQVDAAASGNASAMESFDRLGVSIYDANGNLKDQETIMNEVLRALADMENGTEKARLSTVLFGKSGTEMMPMLNQGSAAIDELTDRAHELGLIMSEDTVKAGVELGDLMDDLKQSFQMVVTQLGTALFPAVQMIVEMILNNIPMINSIVQELVPMLESALMSTAPLILNMAQEVIPILMDAIKQIIPELIPLIQEVLPIITELLLMLIPPLVELLPQALNQLIPIIQWLGDVIKVYVIPAIEMLVEWLGPVLGDTISSIGLLLEGLVQVFSGAFTMVSATVEGFLALLSGDFETWSQKNVEAVGGLVDVVVGLLKTMFSGLITWITGIWDDAAALLSEGITKAVQFFKDGIEKLKNLLKFNWELPKLKMPHFNISGSFSLDPLSVPSFGVEWYAKAMDSPMIMEKPTAFGINSIGQIMAGGEAGSEVVSGTDTLMNMIATVVANQNDGMTDAVNNGFATLMAFLQQYIPHMSNMQVVMDSGAVVGQLAPGMDVALGKLAIRNGRGI